MKLTVKQLKRLIKEEANRVSKENDWNDWYEKDSLDIPDDGYDNWASDEEMLEMKVKDFISHMRLHGATDDGIIRALKHLNKKRLRKSE